MSNIKTEMTAKTKKKNKIQNKNGLPKSMEVGLRFHFAIPSLLGDRPRRILISPISSRLL